MGYAALWQTKLYAESSWYLITFWYHYQKYREESETPYNSAVESVRVRLSPLADVAIGGLLVGTLLTLIYVPMFAYVFDKDNKKS